MSANIFLFAVVSVYLTLPQAVGGVLYLKPVKVLVMGEVPGDMS
jgi:hypothetical protein